MATQQGGHTEVPGGKGPFPPFQKETFASQLVWLALAFVTLYLLMSRIALPRVGGIIAARADRVAADVAEADRIQKQTEAAIAAHENTIAEARTDAQAVATKTRDKLMAEADVRRKALESDLSRKLEQAEKTIAQTKTAAMSNVREIATSAAGAIVERLIGKSPDEKQLTAAVNDALKR